jgi:hypothetical protein
MSVPPVRAKHVLMDYLNKEALVTLAEIENFEAVNEVYYGPAVGNMRIWAFLGNLDLDNRLVTTRYEVSQFRTPESLEEKTMCLKAIAFAQLLISWSCEDPVEAVIRWDYDFDIRTLMSGPAKLAGDEEEDADKAEVRVLVYHRNDPDKPMEYRVVMAKFSRTGWNPIKVIVGYPSLKLPLASRKSNMVIHMTNYGGVNELHLTRVNRVTGDLVDSKFFFNPYITLSALV